MKKALQQLGRRLLPRAARRHLTRATRWPPVGGIDWGDLRRREPISRDWGGDRGTPIDRYYIESFLTARATDVRGRVLEVGEDTYTRRFGGDRVTRSEVVHAAEDNPRADYVADFADAPQLPSGAFDCVLCTQTLQLVGELADGIATLHRILAPGGVLLVTVPGISKIYREEEHPWLDCWRFTRAAARRVFTPAFGEQLEVSAYGNVTAAVAFLHGAAAEELTPEELDDADPLYEMLIAVRAEKAR